MTIPSPIYAFAQNISDNGGHMYLVGGGVRDILLGKTPKDYDFCVTGFTVDKLLKLCPKLKQKLSKEKTKFPVFTLDDGCEIALARIEKSTGIGHRDFEITSNPSITIDEDLKRRDITINSMALDIITNEIIDPFNGQSDLKEGVIRATDTDAFVEDPLRFYRAIRFATTLNFQISKDTIGSMQNMKNSLEKLPPELVSKEFQKAMKCSKPSAFFKHLINLNCLSIHFNEIASLSTPVFNNIMKQLDSCGEKNPDSVISEFLLQLPTTAFENMRKRFAIPRGVYKATQSHSL